MSGTVKPRAAAPHVPSSVTNDGPGLKQNGQAQNGQAQNGKVVGSSTLTYPAEASDDVNMNEVNGLVPLDVTLPNGQRTEITVDYNTPMLDLMVCLAGKSRLNPSGLSLILVSEDSGNPVSYTPNQTIGSLGGRVVRIVSKEVVSVKPTNKDSKSEKPFEVTQRFTVNFPRGQKAVVRVNPAMTLGDLVIMVGQDKGLDLDLHTYILQIPGKPGTPVDLKATIQQVGVHEMNLVAVGLQDRNHTVSMPDLSRPPPSGDQPHLYTSSTGEQKKKKGFLSFLGKKEKKNKPDVQQNLEYRSDASFRTSAPHIQRPTTPPSLHKREHNPDQQITRPKSMFISSNAAAKDYKSVEENLQPLAAPARKKRRAPAPPVPTNSQASVKRTSFSSSENNIAATLDGTTSTQQTLHNETVTITPASLPEEVSAATFVSPHQVSRADMLNRLHSRNSSDSSGYHELTLSGCESPEASHIGDSKYKTSIDTTSIESSDNARGDGGVQESPARELPIMEVQERIHSNSVASASSSQELVVGSTDTLSNKKKRKAPVPPMPPLPVATKTAEETTAETPTAPKSMIVISAAVISQEPVNSPALSDQAPSETTQVPEPSEEAPVPVTEVEVITSQTSTTIPETFADIDNDAKGLEEVSGNSSDVELEQNQSTTFDFNDILEGVVFDEPHSIELTFARRSGDEKWDKDPEMMMETSSVISENIEQVDVSSRSNRPCAFIPPPPPSEPPPAEQSINNFEFTNSNTDRTFVDKGTEVNDEDVSMATFNTDPSFVDKGTHANIEDTSVTTSNNDHTFQEKFTDVEDVSAATSSNFNSPETAHKRRGSYSSLGSIDTIESLSLDFQQAIQLGEEAASKYIGDVEVSSGYKNEMALFVERMSGLAVESAEKTKNEPQDDSVSSASITFSENNSETGSVVQYLQTDSKDTISKAGSLTRNEGKKLRSIDMHTISNNFPEVFQEETTESFAVSEEITEPVMMLPPPPEFDDKDESPNNKPNASSRHLTEAVKHGQVDQDFSTDQQLSKTEKKTEQSTELPKGKGRGGTTSYLRTHVFSPTSIKTEVTPTPIYQSQPRTADPQAPPAAAKKEEFVLTSEDLSSVSFLPPKPKKSKSYGQTQPYVQTQPYPVSTSVELTKHDHALFSRTNQAESASNGNTETNSMQVLAQFNSQPDITVVDEQPRTLPSFPSLRPTVHANNTPVAFDDILAEISLDPLLNKSRPRLLMNSSNNSSRRSVVELIDADGNRKNELNHQSSFNTSKASSAVSDRGDKPSSISHEDKLDGQEQQEDYQKQFKSLQNQFSHWQDQLTRNENLLSSKKVEPEHQAEQPQKLADPKPSQPQQKVEQFQSTTVAQQHKQTTQQQKLPPQQTPQKLPPQQTTQPQKVQPQHQQQIPSYGKDYRKYTALLNKSYEPATTTTEAVSSKTTVPSLLPPPSSQVQPPQPPPAPVQRNSISKAENTATKPRPRSRFEPQLDPRENLMMSIKNFSKEGLKAVSVQKTRQVHSNR